MLQISAFKQVMIWLTCVVGLVLAMPNGFDRPESLIR